MFGILTKISGFAMVLSLQCPVTNKLWDRRGALQVPCGDPSRYWRRRVGPAYKWHGYSRVDEVYGTVKPKYKALYTDYAGLRRPRSGLVARPVGSKAGPPYR